MTKNNQNNDRKASYEAVNSLNAIHNSSAVLVELLEFAQSSTAGGDVLKVALLPKVIASLTDISEGARKYGDALAEELEKEKGE